VPWSPLRSRKNHLSQETNRLGGEKRSLRRCAVVGIVITVKVPQRLRHFPLSHFKVYQQRYSVQINFQRYTDHVLSNF